MSDILWPSTLQPTFNTEGFTEGFAETTIRSTVDQGPSKVRRRFTKGVGAMQATIWLTTIQYLTFKSFYDTDTAGGSLQFLMNHPVSGVPTYFRFAGPPSCAPINSSGIEWSAQFSLEVMP